MDDKPAQIKTVLRWILGPLLPHIQQYFDTLAVFVPVTCAAPTLTARSGRPGSCDGEDPAILQAVAE